MDDRAAIRFGELVAGEALSWIDTPFRWGQAVKGRGCDCKGLIAGVAAALHRPEALTVHALAKDYGEGRFSPFRLQKGLAAIFDQVRGAIPGDVLLIWLNSAPQHLGICTAANAGQPTSMVHCYAAGIARVRSTPLGSGHRIASVWRWRAIGES